MRIAEALRDAARTLATTSDTARLDAELLMAHALGATRSDLLLHQMDNPVPSEFAALVERRARHEPIAYISGHQEFFGLDLEVTPEVLIPRADSETLIDAARAVFNDRPPSRILDLGTGSGALLLGALSVWPQAAGVGIDSSQGALDVATRNATRVGINPAAGSLDSGEAETGRAQFVQRDWTRLGWHEGLGQFDLILANPPYVETGARLEPAVRDWEPPGALFAGPDGLDDYTILLPQLAQLMTWNSRVIVEIGATQAEAVGTIARNAGFACELGRDLAGRPRTLVMEIRGWQSLHE